MKNEVNFMTNCNFCGKHDEEVNHLVVGPCVSICDQCVEHAQQSINQIKDQTSPMASLRMS